MGFDVHVVNSDGDGVGGIRVVLGFIGLTRGMSSTEYTDSDGHAEFDGYAQGSVEVFVDGNNRGIYTYKDGGGITISL